MAAPITVPDQPIASHSVSGLLSLLLLLLCAIAAAAAFTAYLLRTSVPHQAVTPAPAPYWIWYQQGSQIRATTGDGRHARTLAALPAAGSQGARTLSVAPDGRRMLLVATQDTGDRAWLLSSPVTAPLSIPLPTLARGLTPLHCLATAWPDPHGVTLLWANAAGTRGVFERYMVGTRSEPAHVSWTPLAFGGARIVSLSPTADQVALVEARAGGGAFASQVVVRLRHLGDPRGSVALRYLGNAQPSAVLWSPDGGTLAIAVPGQGLAIQKSSGRPVRQVPDGALPAAFSPRAAELAYLSGSANRWQIHVLNLHGEVENQFAAPMAARPSWLRWTPDARALLFAANGVLWQIDPGTGAAHRLRAVVNGPLLGLM